VRNVGGKPLRAKEREISADLRVESLGKEFKKLGM